MNRPFRKGITLPRVSVLSHDPELQRVLGRMERNTEAAVQHLSRERMETLARTPIQRSDYDALLGEFVLIDPTGGAITVRLPKVATTDAGRWLVVKNASGSSNTINVVAAAQTEFEGIAGAEVTVSSNPYASARILCDGKGFWRF